MTIIFLIGRILFGGFFLHSAYGHLANSKALAGYAQFKGVPMPKAAVIFSGLLLLIGGLSIVSGALITLGVGALVLFLVPVTFQMHGFWNEEGDGKAMQRVMFAKNAALLGAALMLLSIPTPWALSLGF